MGFDFDIDTGQLVRIKLNGTTKFLGVCSGNNRSGHLYSDKRRTTYNFENFKTMLSKKIVSTITFNTGTSIATAVKNTNIMDYTMGVTAGDIRCADTFAEKQIIDGKSITEILDEFAGLATAHWYVDTDLNLNFFTTVTTSECTVSLDTDFGAFTDFREVSIDESISEYANWVLLVGGENYGMTEKVFRYNNDDFDEMLNRTGYSSQCGHILSDTNIVEVQDANFLDAGTDADTCVDFFAVGAGPTIASGDMIYNKTRKAYSFITTVSVSASTRVIYDIAPSITGQISTDTIYYMPYLNNAVKNLVNAKCGYAPNTITFSSNTDNFNVRERLYCNIPDLSIQGYYNIIGVSINDLGADNWDFSVTAQRKNYNDYTVLSDLGYMQYFKRK